MAEDGLQRESNDETEVPSEDAPSAEGTHDRIPFTGVCR